MYEAYYEVDHEINHEVNHEANDVCLNMSHEACFEASRLMSK
jgi:hypothetical protein